MTGRKQPARRICPRWDPDPDIGADHRNRLTCRTCLRVGEDGDANHTPPPAPPAPTQRLSPEMVAAALDRDAAILGERDDREEYR
ncbi:hypothetical protein AB0873_14855 [Micromonospora sp. NPDC047707]|uniref:hypothetical protein n=1 Tax=Micromonospora sp. NPDC047707 TaxID=3154498 RepID=UPI00345596BB